MVPEYAQTRYALYIMIFITDVT
ncbi:hypothetical protein FPSE_04324 [Fusarium pseudograminearum CS3096]|uniref:Uncharacterized protein n=1 Tax=Fusarium pseudograminearum (strain CS3096) TaxID=1028729 RepID=K3VLP2_FUSPC|nr:hypothetical protein FPSE_04324 [Fusarium pseudograminearum CS3096]EKJ75549.1 hypothetical protein FPSE_04324 [Fusarium pseudograminearum CS3096]